MVLNEVEKALGSVAAQLMNGEEVIFEEQKIRVQRVGSGRLRMVQFRLNGRVFEAIEQSREAEPVGKAGARKTSGGAVSRCGDA